MLTFYDRKKKYLQLTEFNYTDRKECSHKTPTFTYRGFSKFFFEMFSKDAITHLSSIDIDHSKFLLPTEMSRN